MTPVRKVAAVLGAGALIVGLLAAVAYSDPPDQPSDPIVHRGDRYQPEPAGTKSNYNFWFGPYTVPPEVYIVLRVHFIHGTMAQLKALGGRPYHDVRGVLFGRTYNVPRVPNGIGVFQTALDDKKGLIHWTSTVDGTIIGTGGHLHP